MSFWQKLSGYKTKIGAAFMLAAQVGPMVYPAPEVWEIVNKLGALIAGVGLAHTATKKAGLNL